MVLCTLSIGENIATLLGVDTGDTITWMDHSQIRRSPDNNMFDVQQTALQSQGHWSFRGDDGLTCLRYVHLENGLPVDLLQSGLCAQRCNQPSATRGESCRGGSKEQDRRTTPWQLHTFWMLELFVISQQLGERMEACLEHVTEGRGVVLLS